MLRRPKKGSLLTFGIIFFLCFSMQLYGQSIGSSLPKKVKKSAKYVFYLHGAVVTYLGNNAINPPVAEYGPYEYLNILDTLKKRGFEVISERRWPEVKDSVYVNKIAGQIDSLLLKRVKPGNIVVLGASAGWGIGIRVSAKVKNKEVKYVLMGGCWPNDYKEYVHLELYGDFLSIIEATDPRGTCYALFENSKYSKEFKEIRLNTGLSHGFIYKGYKEWVDPVADWCKLKK